MALSRTVLTLLVLLFCTPLHAGKVISSMVDYSDGRYVLEFDMHINASPDRVYALVTDYDHLSQLNDSIKSSKLVASTDATHHRVRVVSKACVLFFCKTIHQVQDIEELDASNVLATIIAEQSDFDYAHARWHIRGEDNGTRITFSTDLKPSFWVPPLIGPAIIKSKLESEALTTIENLEKLSNRNDAKTVQ